MKTQVPPWPRSVSKGSGVAVSCSVGHRCGLDAMWLWLWCRLAAIAPIRPLVWEPPYAIDVALKSKKTKYKTNKQTKNKKKIETDSQTWRTDLRLPKGRGREWDGLGV